MVSWEYHLYALFSEQHPEEGQRSCTHKDKIRQHGAVWAETISDPLQDNQCTECSCTVGCLFSLVIMNTTPAKLVLLSAWLMFIAPTGSYRKGSCKQIVCPFELAIFHFSALHIPVHCTKIDDDTAIVHLDYYGSIRSIGSMARILPSFCFFFFSQVLEV